MSEQARPEELLPYAERRRMFDMLQRVECPHCGSPTSTESLDTRQTLADPDRHVVSAARQFYCGQIIYFSNIEPVLEDSSTSQYQYGLCPLHPKRTKRPEEELALVDSLIEIAEASTVSQDRKFYILEDLRRQRSFAQMDMNNLQKAKAWRARMHQGGGNT